MNISRLLDGSINTTTCRNTGLQNKTSEELVQEIREHIAELHCRGLIVDSTKFHEYQLSAAKSLEDWKSGKINPVPLLHIDSFPFEKFTAGMLPPTVFPIKTNINKEEEFAKAVKLVWNGMKEVFHSYVDPLMEEINTQNRIEELEKILRKHPNRQDLRMELMKLQKTLPKKIGKPKRKKK